MRQALRIVSAILALGVTATPLPAAGRQTLWVVQPPGLIVAFEPSTFDRVGDVRIPVAAYEQPSRLAINGRGQILANLADGTAWVWDSATSRVVPAGRDSSRAWPRGSPAPMRQWFLGDDGQSLVVFESGSEVADVDTAATRVRIVITDLGRRERRVLLDERYRACMHLVEPTGAEQCPAPEISVPEGVLRGCYLLTRWCPDSTSEGSPNAEYAEDDPLYRLPVGSSHRTWFRRTRDRWGGEEVEGDVTLLDADDDGAIRLQIGDPSWNTSCSDVVVAGADTTIAIGPCARFETRHYETVNWSMRASLAPGGQRVAAGYGGANPVLRDEAEVDGITADSLELDTLRSAVSELPIVEVYSIRPARRLLRLVRAELVGWTSASELLVVERRRLVAIDIETGRRRASSIEVRSAADAFVVRP